MSEWDRFVGKIVTIQFTGNLMICKAAVRGGELMPVVLAAGQATPTDPSPPPLATQMVEGAVLRDVTDKHLFFEMKAPGGSVVEAAVAAPLVANIWRVVTGPTSDLIIGGN